MIEQALAGKSIALSISDSPSLYKLGLSQEHLQDAMAEIARYLLASGARLVYGGDLRPGGFTRVLLELAETYYVPARDRNVNGRELPIMNVLAWPVHCTMGSHELLEWRDSFGRFGELVCLSQMGSVLDLQHRAADSSYHSTQVSERDWKRGLTLMRSFVTSICEARVVLGGQLDGFKGAMPGIAEEVIQSFDANIPVYLCGGYGGCARVIWRSLLEGNSDDHGPSPDFAHAFDVYGVSSLRNGLDAEDNFRLYKTTYSNEIASLILKGLVQVRSA